MASPAAKPDGARAKRVRRLPPKLRSAAERETKDVHDRLALTDEPNRPTGGFRPTALLIRLWLKPMVGSVFLVSLAFVLGLMTLLNLLKFQTVYNELAERHMGVILARYHRSLETAIDLGLDLGAIGADRMLAASTQSKDTRIKNTYIFNSESGRIVFSTDPTA